MFAMYFGHVHPIPIHLISVRPTCEVNKIKEDKINK